MLKKLVCVLLVLGFSAKSEAMGLDLSKEVGNKVKCSCDYTVQINPDFTDGEIVFESTDSSSGDCCYKVQINSDFTDGEIVYESVGMCSHKCNVNYNLKDDVVNNLNK